MWYLGGSSEYEGLYADDFYYFERNNSGYGSNPTRWIGKVGIMYPSDYLYAADLSICKYSAYDWDEDHKGVVGYGGFGCYNSNWLNFGKGTLFISPNSSDSHYFYSNSSDGYVTGIPVYSTLSIWPVVVLKSNVKMLGGEGTRDNPYKIGI